MATAEQHIRITDFSPAMNREFDPRSLMPEADGEPAEGALVENWDVADKGAIITATGYEEYIDLATSQPVVWGGEYIYSPLYRHHLACSNENIYQLRKFDYLVFHDCDAYNSGTYGTWSVSDDATAVATDTGTYQRGAGAVSVTIDTTASANNYATMEVTRPSPLDLSSYTYLELLGILNGVTGAASVYYFTSITIRVGTNSSNYWEQTFTAPLVAAASQYEADYWFGLRFALGSGTTVGSPSLSTVQYMMVRLNYNSSITTLSNFRIDDIIATKPGTTVRAIDITGPRWQSSVDAPAIINATPYKGQNATPIMVLANKSQSAAIVRHVGPNMLIAAGAAGVPANSYIVASMLGFLLSAKDNVLTYTTTENENGTGGSLKFDGKITGLAPTVNKTMLVTLDGVSTQEVRFQFDDATLTYTPVKGEYQVGTYGYSHKTIAKAKNNSLFLGNEGVQYFGQTEEAANANYRINSLSWKIDKFIQSLINYKYAEVAAGCYYARKKEYHLAIPAGREIDFNNQFFTYKLQYDAWVYRSGILPAHIWEYREADRSELFFGSSQTDKIYKFNNFYDFAGAAYVRRYKFKTFTMGAPTRFKTYRYIEVAGAMPHGAEFYVVIRTDGREVFIKIDDTALVLTNVDLGGTIGDENVGDQYIGGAEASDSNPYPLYRFYKQITIPDQYVNFREAEVEFYQNAAGQPLKIDYFDFCFAYEPSDMVPDIHRAVANDQTAEITLPSTV